MFTLLQRWLHLRLTLFGLPQVNHNALCDECIVFDAEGKSSLVYTGHGFETMLCKCLHSGVKTEFLASDLNLINKHVT